MLNPLLIYKLLEVKNHVGLSITEPSLGVCHGRDPGKASWNG